MKKRIIFVMNTRYLSVHGLYSLSYVCPKICSDGLMTQANTQDRYLLYIVVDYLHQEPCMIVFARARREHYSSRIARYDLLKWVVVAHHECLQLQLMKVIDQIICERIKIIDN